MIGRVIIKSFSFFYKRINPIGYARFVGVKIGERCILESCNFGSEPYLISIGNHVEITTNVSFITHDGATWVLRDDPMCQDVIRYGMITIKDNVFIGHGTIILPNVVIGNNVIVGAGSVITTNIPDNCVYAGVPARYICTIKEYASKCIEETPKWDKKAYARNKKEELLRLFGIE